LKLGIQVVLDSLSKRNLLISGLKGQGQGNKGPLTCVFPDCCRIHDDERAFTVANINPRRRLMVRRRGFPFPQSALFFWLITVGLCYVSFGGSSRCCMLHSSWTTYRYAIYRIILNKLFFTSLPSCIIIMRFDASHGMTAVC